MNKWVRFGVCATFCVVMLFPLYCMLIVAFTPRSELFSGGTHLWPASFTTSNFTRLFDAFPIGTWFGNSVVVAGITTAVSVTVNLLAGYAFAKLHFVGKNALFLLILSTMMIPAQAIMIPQFRMVSWLGLFGTFWAVILPSASTAFGIFLARQFIQAIPDELIEAARVDGAGNLRIFLRIVLPLCKPLIAVLTLLTVLSTWNDFAWPLIALKESELFTLPIGMLFLKGAFGSDYGAIMAFALLSVLPMIALFLLFQRYFVQGFARSGIR